MRPAHEVFSAWAATGLDLEMAETHAPRCAKCLKHVGLGNVEGVSGDRHRMRKRWVVRMLRKHPACRSATGVDGSAAMT